MGTAKRERQKANRKLRLEEIAKERRKAKSKRTLLRVGAIVGVVVVLVGALTLMGGDDEETATTTSTTLVPTDSTLLPTDSTLPGSDPVFSSVPAKPSVSLPAELPTELQVTALREGSGAAAAVGDTVWVHYVGVRSADGAEFDNSYDRGEPFSLTLGSGGVIAGWDQGLVGVQLGGMYQLDIPADLAYGADAAPEVAGELTFVVEIMAIRTADGTLSTLPAEDATADTTADTTVGTNAPATT